MRREDEMQRALEVIAALNTRRRGRHYRQSRVRQGWHTALDLDSLLTVSEIVALAGLERKEPGRTLPRLSPTKIEIRRI